MFRAPQKLDRIVNIAMPTSLKGRLLGSGGMGFFLLGRFRSRTYPWDVLHRDKSYTTDLDLSKDTRLQPQFLLSVAGPDAKPHAFSSCQPRPSTLLLLVNQTRPIRRLLWPSHPAISHTLFTASTNRSCIHRREKPHASAVSLPVMLESLSDVI